MIKHILFFIAFLATIVGYSQSTKIIGATAPQYVVTNRVAVKPDTTITATNNATANISTLVDVLGGRNTVTLVITKPTGVSANPSFPAITDTLLGTKIKVKLYCETTSENIGMFQADLGFTELWDGTQFIDRVGAQPFIYNLEEYTFWPVQDVNGYHWAYTKTSGSSAADGNGIYTGSDSLNQTTTHVKFEPTQNLAFGKFADPLDPDYVNDVGMLFSTEDWGSISIFNKSFALEMYEGGFYSNGFNELSPGSNVYKVSGLNNFPQYGGIFGHDRLYVSSPSKAKGFNNMASTFQGSISESINGVYWSKNGAAAGLKSQVDTLNDDAVVLTYSSSKSDTVDYSLNGKFTTNQVLPNSLNGISGGGPIDKQLSAIFGNFSPTKRFEIGRFVQGTGVQTRLFSVDYQKYLGNAIRMYDKYDFPNAAPSTTSGRIQLLNWTAGTPSFSDRYISDKLWSNVTINADSKSWIFENIKKYEHSYYSPGAMYYLFSQDSTEYRIEQSRGNLRGSYFGYSSFNNYNYWQVDSVGGTRSATLRLYPRGIYFNQQGQTPYFLTPNNSSPSSTSGALQAIGWTGNGSTATPSFFDPVPFISSGSIGDNSTDGYYKTTTSWGNQFYNSGFRIINGALATTSGAFQSSVSDGTNSASSQIFVSSLGVPKYSLALDYGSLDKTALLEPFGFTTEAYYSGVSTNNQAVTTYQIDGQRSVEHITNSTITTINLPEIVGNPGLNQVGVGFILHLSVKSATNVTINVAGSDAIIVDGVAGDQTVLNTVGGTGFAKKLVAVGSNSWAIYK